MRVGINGMGRMGRLTLRAAMGAVRRADDDPRADNRLGVVLVTGLAIFGLPFAVNSSLHSYLIVSYASEDGVSLDVGFYYMANALGRLLGTVLSGAVFQAGGLVPCLWIAAALVALAAVISLALPKHQSSADLSEGSLKGDD